MSAIAELGDRLAALKPEEARDLRLMMKDRWNIEPAGGPPKQAEPEEEAPPPAPEPTEFSVTLTDYADAAKLNIIKLVREITGMSLADANNAVKAKNVPIRPSASKAEAADLKARIEAAGGTVTVTPIG